MDGLSKEYLISFYGKKLLFHGDRPEALGWSPSGQRAQYGNLIKIGDLTGLKILDYGCGKGDFFNYLKDSGIKCDYTGFDINPSLIELAKKKHPDGRFKVFDIEDENLTEDFDYIFLCGVFNNNIEGVKDSFKNVLKLLFAHASRGLAFTALSTDSKNKDFELNYTNPVGMEGFIKGQITPDVKSFHDGDILIMYLYREKYA